MTEIELKFLIDEAAERRLRRLPQLTDGASGTERLRTVYYDTPDGRLAAAGIALRLRRAGRRWTQTVKAGRTMRGGLSEALEVEAPAPGGRIDLAAIPDDALRERVSATLDGAPVSPVFETDIRRTTCRVNGDLGAVVEVAIDRGEIRAGEAAKEFREAELELVSGTPAALFDLARRLFPEGGVRFSTMSKAARGAMLAREGRIDGPVAPRGAEDVPLAPDMTAEAAGRAILAECFEQVAANVAVALESDEPEGPHQLRVGLRRLRTALRLFRPAFDGPRHRAIEEEAKWLGREVGRLRDLDVALVEMVLPERTATPGEPGFDRLADALAGQGAEERVRLRATLASSRVNGFVFDLAEYVALRGWLLPADAGQTGRLARPVAELAAEALDKADRRAAKGARHIAGLDPEARHELRKKLKQLRYAVEFLGPLYEPERVKPLVKALKSLQDLFGELNDAAMAEGLFVAEGAPAGDDPAAARAAGRLIGARNERATRDWAEAKARWKAFAAVPRPWRKARHAKG